MLGTARTGPGLLVLRRTQGLGAARLRLQVPGPLGHPQGELKPVSRFFARMLPLRQQQQTGQTKHIDGKQGHPPKHTDTGTFNPVSLPGTGSRSFGFGAGGGADAVVTALIGIAVIFFGGTAYVEWYKAKVLRKIEKAFAPGYDPTLELVNHPSRSSGMDDAAFGSSHIMKREEQQRVDSIMAGKDVGRYYLFMGPKGGGKSTMVVDAMKELNADGISMCDAHPDLEVFRLRLGKALNYKFNEDSQMGLFQRRDPHEGGPRLDIERAMNKLEKVAIKRAAKTGRPIVLVINNIHLFNNDDEGRLLLKQLQQRAESWAESHIATMVFTSNDFWPYPVMRQIAKRMYILTVQDLDPEVAFKAFQEFRREHGQRHDPEEIVKQAIQVSGGRLAYMSRLAYSKHLERSTDQLKRGEKAWLLANIGLIPDCDSDVLDEQKRSSSTWLLLREFVKRREALEREAAERIKENLDSPEEFIPMPKISYYECRQILTRPDLINQLDHLNIISIDINHDIRLDSMLTFEAARDIVSEEGFDELLKGVRDRVDEIESLHRTRELTARCGKRRSYQGYGGQGWI
ncbi:AAA domain protein, putative [Rhizoctonia solani AG-3 Rhs1AP]|uniref:AAA domain protein, putative n=1 Tax=Rhizoctonia solani AG-3 Rhs1AP TaxID=1086054 RepID=X8IZN0_9AGAM|nr:AAA domain protein, putative [Rhizoctonia solani AG-3 Rhs1AP]